MSFNVNAVSGSGSSNSSHKLVSKSDIEAKLKALGVPAEVIAQGPDAVKKYASEHNIDLSSIQPPKREKNEENSDSSVKGSKGNKKQEFEAKLEALGIPADTIKQGKEAVEKYAKENNITLPTPPRHGSKIDYKA